MKSLDKNKKNKIIEYAFLAILALTVVVVFVTNFIPSKQESFSVDSYVKNLETKLSNILSKVENCGTVDVMITVASGTTTVLAEETLIKETSSGQEVTTTPVVINGETVVLKTIYPEIIGVLIISEGANSLTVKSKLLQATSSVLNVSTDKIEILTKR